MLVQTRLAAIDGPLQAWLAERHERGQDRFDEVWDGVLHVAPAERTVNASVTEQLLALLRQPGQQARLRSLAATNVGNGLDYRVPDALWVPDDLKLTDLTYLDPATVSMVLETLSPGEVWETKARWYAKHGIRSMVLANPDERTVRAMQYRNDQWQDQADVLLGRGPLCTNLVDAITWD